MKSTKQRQAAEVKEINLLISWLRWRQLVGLIERGPKQLTLRGKFFILLFAAIQLGRAKEEVRLISSSLFTLFLFLSLLSF